MSMSGKIAADRARLRLIEGDDWHDDAEVLAAAHASACRVAAAARKAGYVATVAPKSASQARTEVTLSVEKDTPDGYKKGTATARPASSGYAVIGSLAVADQSGLDLGFLKCLALTAVGAGRRDELRSE